MFGGTGSGKTTTSSAIVSDTMRSIPSTKVVAFAQILDQLESTAKAELRKFFFEDEFVTFNKDK